jgi:hypothetical protein
MDKILEYLKIQARFKKHYCKGLIGISDDSIQIDEKLFFNNFKTFKVEKYKEAYHYNVILNGIKIIAVCKELHESEETV